MILRTDKGSEFLNSLVKNYLKQKGIKHIVTQNSTKTAFAERTIFTIKRRLLQAMIAQKSKRWLEVTASYNSSYHRSIGMKPNEVTKRHEANIWNRLYMPKPKRPKLISKKPFKKNTFQFKIGDTVNVTMDTHKFNKGYNKRFSDENYQIADRALKQGKEVYTVKDLENKSILGTWYKQELQRVADNTDEQYEIEKIIKTRYYRGKKQYLVHWVGWNKKFDSWIDSDSVEDYK